MSKEQPQEGVDGVVRGQLPAGMKLAGHILKGFGGGLAFMSVWPVALAWVARGTSGYLPLTAASLTLLCGVLLVLLGASLALPHDMAPPPTRYAIAVAAEGFGERGGIGWPIMVETTNPVRARFAFSVLTIHGLQLRLLVNGQHVASWPAACASKTCPGRIAGVDHG